MGERLMDTRLKGTSARLSDRIFLWVSIAGTLLCLAELALQFFGRSICPTAGCKVVADQARFGDVSILLLGGGTFALLAILSALSLKARVAFYERSLDALLIAALASEGFFTGYQAFVVRTPCLFCLLVFGLISALGALRLFSGRPGITAGFVAMAAVFALQFLILPAGVTAPFPLGNRLLLFYGKDCKYCAEIMKELEEKRIPVTHVLVGSYASYLKQMGIEHIPTLMVNDPQQKLFLTGTNAIRRFLSPPAAPQETLAEVLPPAATGKKPALSPAKDSPAHKPLNPPATKSTVSAPEGTPQPSRIESPPLLFDLSQPPGPPAPESEDGMCKQDVDCD